MEISRTHGTSTRGRWSLGADRERPAAVYLKDKESHRLKPVRAEPDDVALLALVARGDIESFQTFHERWAGRVLAYVRRLSRSRELDEDVVQDVFLSVWRKAGSYRPERGDVAGWLYTMTRNKLVDLWRRAGLDAESDEELARLTVDREAGGDLLLTVQQALSRVETEQRRAIEMAYFGGLTYEETARRLALPVGTLKSRIRAGLRTMRSVLEAG